MRAACLFDSARVVDQYRREEAHEVKGTGALSVLGELKAEVRAVDANSLRNAVRNSPLRLPGNRRQSA